MTVDRPFEDVHDMRACPYYGDGFTFYTEAEPRLEGCICWMDPPAPGWADLIVRLMCDDGPQSSLVSEQRRWFEALPEREQAALRTAMPDYVEDIYVDPPEAL